MSFLLSYGRKFQHFLGKTPRVSRPFEPSPLSVIFLPREPRSHSPAAARPQSLALPDPHMPSPPSRRALRPIPVAAHDPPSFPALPRQNGNL